MSLLETLASDMKQAMKNKEKELLSTIRFLLSGLKNLSIDKKGDLSEEDELSFLATEAKRRRESIVAFTDADRADLAEKEQAELLIIETYLPKPLTIEEAKALVQESVAETGAEGKKDMGKVMTHVMPKLKGRFPGKDVKDLVLSFLS